MLTLAANGTLVWDGLYDMAHSQARVSIALPADLLVERDELIDRVFDFVFDELSATAVELRVYEEGPNI